jgi:hypothetical protein
MPARVDDRASSFEEIDRFDGGVGWIAHPEETMLRASHALEIDGEVWVIDPVDAAGIDDLLADAGEVAGVVVLLDRHKRDAAAIATRHDASVYLPDFFEGVESDIDAPVTRFGSSLADTRLEAYPVVTSRFWRECALYDPEAGTLVVPESVGTAPYFLASGERLGVHPMRRPFPPRRLEQFDPERVLVGHGRGVLSDADRALTDTLANARTRMPRAYLNTLRTMVTG